MSTFKNEPVKFNQITNDDVDVRNVPIDYSAITGYPTDGVEIQGLDKSFHADYDDSGKVIPDSVDESKIRRLTFHCLSLNAINRNRKMVDAKIIDKKEYVESLAEMDAFDLVINGEDYVSQFLAKYSSIVEGIENGQVYDVVSPVILTGTWNRGYSKLHLAFFDVSNVTFEPFDPKTLGGGSNGSK